MRKLTCKDCGKRYDFDVDDFCPRCGSFNQPMNKWRIDAAGQVVRVDGVNESNHTGSFVHREVHTEKAARKAKGLDRDAVSVSKKKDAAAVNTAQTLRTAAHTVRTSATMTARSKGKARAAGATWVALIVTLLSLISMLIENLA